MPRKRIVTGPNVPDLITPAMPPPEPPDETRPSPAADDPNPGACCPKCGCRHAPVQFTQRSGKRTIRTRRCRNCGKSFREVATVIP